MPSNPGHEKDKEAKLYIVSTPIGNLADITLRALDTLRKVDLIAAEDTRHTRKLLSYYDIHVRLVSYHEHNARLRGGELLDKIASGQSVALVTDAGTPGVSDPGQFLIEAALQRGMEPVAIPGPTALISALVVSGLSTQPFVFLGFPPAKGAERRRFFEKNSLGAVLGLIQVMQHLDKIDEVGRGIAVAFVATIYGVAAANLFLLPVAGKLRIRIREEEVLREMTLEGVISLLEGMNPRMVEARLLSFLAENDSEDKAKGTTATPK